jgi:adenylate cyclase
MISEMTRREIGPEFCCRLLDRIQVMGKKEPVAVYELVEMADTVPGERQQGYRRFEEGLSLYFERKWDEAIACFTSAIEALGGDTASNVFIERARKFKETPPADSWNGVWEMTSK